MSGRGVTLTPHSFSCRGQERVHLYLYSPYGPYGMYRASVPVQGCTLYDMTQWRLVNSCRHFGQPDCFQLRDRVRLYLDCHKDGGSTINRQDVMTQKTRFFTDWFVSPTLDLVWTLEALLQYKALWVKPWPCREDEHGGQGQLLHNGKDWLEVLIGLGRGRGGN